jgi:hypothetical protein
MITKFTKGPWKCITVYDDNYNFSFFINQEKGREIKCDLDSEESNANCRLIEKSPELFNALESLVKQLQNIPNEMLSENFEGFDLDEARQILQDIQ